MEENNSIYLQRLCASVKQVQIEASQTNEFLVRDGRTPLQLCGRYEDIFCHRYRSSALSLLRKKSGFWGVVKEISRKEALTRIKNLQHPETDLGRCRAWIRLAANENSLVAYIMSLLSNPEFLAKYYEPQAFLRDSDLTEAAMNVLSGLDTIRFELTIDTSSLEVEIAPDAYIPADKLSRMMALELARAVQQIPTEPVLIERRPLRKKRRKNKKFNSQSTDTDSPEMPDSESDYGSMRPPATNPLAVDTPPKDGRGQLPWYSSSFEHSHGALFTDSSLMRSSPNSEMKGITLSTSAPPTRAVFPKQFISERKETPSPISPSLEQIEEISEVPSSEVKSKPFDLLSPILASPNTDPITTLICDEANGASSLDIITPQNMESFPFIEDQIEDITILKSKMKLDLENPQNENESESIPEKSFKSIDLSPPQLKLELELAKSPPVYKDFPSPYKPMSTYSHPIQTFLTADAVDNQTSNRNGTPNSFSANSHSSSDDFFSINGEWDVIRMEDTDVPVETLDTIPFQSKFTDDYFMQEINVDKLTQNQLYSTMKRIREELKNVTKDHPSHKILVHTLVKLRIRRLEMAEGVAQLKPREEKCLRISGHILEVHSGGKNPPKLCEICGKHFNPVNITKQKWCLCRECKLTLHVSCVKRIPSICPTQANPQLILQNSPELGLLAQKFKCHNCSRQIGLGGKEEPRLCRYTGIYFCQNCYSITPATLPAKIVHDWDFRVRGVSLSSYLCLKVLHSSPCINLTIENPLIYSYENTLSECSIIRDKLKQIYLFLNVCQNAKQLGLLAVHQGILHDHIWIDKEPWSIADLFNVKEGLFLPTLKELFSKWDSHIRQCARCSGNGHYCLGCHSEDIIFPWDILAISCETCGTLYHSHCTTESGCSRCALRAKHYLWQYLFCFRYFELVKGPTGLGLSLKGGRDEKTPIIVKNMHPQGNAFLSGLIEVGDEIVEINSKSFADINAKEGIEFLKDLPIGPVRFLIKKK
ncbi:hypothetical protein LOD99_9669 [Oopsacas minuta]|uniref:RUN domain-containing protein n=1 Tax=Oopsacas minuta TaxID=111878 RepID=A0AAV7KMF3_9METZ|nr:hypothetical protein LOD99_9669 [Oopsacas minuta]